MEGTESATVRTIARFRPPNRRERELGFDEKKSGIVLQQPGSIIITPPNSRKKTFPFHVNKVFGAACTQVEVFESAAAASVRDLFDGYNSTVFAYGQTGAGKSFSMFGSLADPVLQGITPRAVQCVFDNIMLSAADSEFTISVSYIEVYREQIKDLLAHEEKKLTIRQSPQKGIYVENLQTEYVGSVAEVYDCIEIGNDSRKVARTDMNAVSSRSHSVFTLYLHQADADGVTKQAKFNLVDLAGSEKISKSGASGVTLEEAKKINLSLTCLSQCINALSSGKSSHVPFRTSKLTRLLQESLGGNSKTTLLVACSPHPDNIEETMSTLRFAERCSFIQNEVVKNVHMSVEQLTEMVAKLQTELGTTKSYATAMEQQLKAAGLTPGNYEAKRRTFKSVGVQADPSAAEDSQKGSPKLSRRRRKGKGKGTDKSAKALLADVSTYEEANLCAVVTKVAFMGFSESQFSSTMQRNLVSTVTSFVEDHGVTEDDVHITQMVEQSTTLMVHVVIVCDSPNVDAIKVDLKRLIASGGLLQLVSENLQIKTNAITFGAPQEEVIANKPLTLQHSEIHSQAAVPEERQLLQRDSMISATFKEDMLQNRPRVEAKKQERLLKVAEEMVRNQSLQKRAGDVDDGQTLSARQLSFERLNATIVDNQTELMSMRGQLEDKRAENEQLGSLLDLRQLEMDSCKERLVTANTKCMRLIERIKKMEKMQVSDVPENSKNSALDDISALRKTPGRKMKGRAAITSREETDVDDDDARPAIKPSWLRKPAKTVAKPGSPQGGVSQPSSEEDLAKLTRSGSAKDALFASDNEEGGMVRRDSTASQADSLTGTANDSDPFARREEPRYRNSFNLGRMMRGAPQNDNPPKEYLPSNMIASPPSLSVRTNETGATGVGTSATPKGKLPPLNLSRTSTLMSSTIHEIPRESSYKGNDPSAPRHNHDHEEIDELQAKNETLNRTVTRQQNLVERQADMLSQMADKAKQAQLDVVLITQERDMLQERVGKLELKLYKHGIAVREEKRAAPGGSMARRGSTGGALPSTGAPVPNIRGGLGRSQTMNVTRGSATTRDSLPTAKTVRGSDGPPPPAANVPRIRKPIMSNDNSRLKTVRTTRGAGESAREEYARTMQARQAKDEAARQSASDNGALGGLSGLFGLGTSRPLASNRIEENDDFFSDDEDERAVEPSPRPKVSESANKSRGGGFLSFFG